MKCVNLLLDRKLLIDRDAGNWQNALVKKFVRTASAPRHTLSESWIVAVHSTQTGRDTLKRKDSNYEINGGFQ